MALESAGPGSFEAVVDERRLRQLDLLISSSSAS